MKKNHTKKPKSWFEITNDSLIKNALSIIIGISFICFLIWRFDLLPDDNPFWLFIYAIFILLGLILLMIGFDDHQKNK